MTDSPEDVPQEEQESLEDPPVLGSWPRLYAVVLGFLAFQVVVYWVITQVYA